MAQGLRCCCGGMQAACCGPSAGPPSHPPAAGHSRCTRGYQHSRQCTSRRGMAASRWRRAPAGPPPLCRAGAVPRTLQAVPAAACGHARSLCGRWGSRQRPFFGSERGAARRPRAHYVTGLAASRSSQVSGLAPRAPGRAAVSATRSRQPAILFRSGSRCVDVYMTLFDTSCANKPPIPSLPRWRRRGAGAGQQA